MPDEPRDPEPPAPPIALPAAMSSRPDPHGEAALLLIESLVHGLIARSGLSIEEAIAIVQTAADAQIAIGDDRGDVAVRPAAHLLAAIAASLCIDAGAPPLPTPPR